MSHSAESEPTGIHFAINNEDLLVQAVLAGQGGKVAHTVMESPIESLAINLSSDSTNFDLVCRWSTQFEARYGVGAVNFNYKDVIKQVTTTLGTQQEITERGANYIFKGPRGTNFVLGSGRLGQDDICLSTGKIEELMGDTIQVIASPEVSEESVSVVLADTVDIATLVSNAYYEVAGKKQPNQTVEINPPRRPTGNVGRTALEGMRHLQDKVEVEKPKVNFDEIGGQEAAKQEIEGLSFALSNPDLYKKWGTKPPKGILLYGPPGTGKTLMAKALASQADARFLHVKASDIGSKWYGESEQIVEQIFEYAGEGNGNTIIYFDEIDSIVPSRGTSTHEATQKVIGTLLQCIDGMGSKDNVMIVASTNRRDSIDSAMLRPGRLDRLVEVPLPDENGREGILRIHIEKAQQLAGDANKLFNGIDLEEIAKQTDGYSGADIAEIIRRVLEAKVRLEGRGEEPGLVTAKDFMYQIHNYERSKKASTINPELVNTYKDLS